MRNSVTSFKRKLLTSRSLPVSWRLYQLVKDIEETKLISYFDTDGSKPQGITPHGTRVATPTPEASAADTSRVAGVPPRTRSYAAALKAPTTDYHYRFSHNGQDIGYQESLYGAISRIKRMSGTTVRLSFYDRQLLKVKKVEGPAPLPGEHDESLDGLFERDDSLTGPFSLLKAANLKCQNTLIQLRRMDCPRHSRKIHLRRPCC